MKPTDMPEAQKNHELRNRQWFAALFAVLAAIVYLRISQLGGRLAADLTFDDVGYANDAARRLLMGADQGLFALARSFVETPPHSPFSTLLALCAFAIGGIDDMALYASNSLVLVAAAVFVTHETGHVRRSILILVLCIVLLSPIAYRTIHDFRPDIALGLVTAVMAWWFISGLVDGEPRLLRRAGYAFGACLLIKPSFFAHTLAIALFLACLAMLTRIHRVHALGCKHDPNARDLTWFLGLGILISAPHFILNWSPTYNHFWENTRGAQAEIWSFPTGTPILELLMGTLTLTFNILGYHLLFSVGAVLLCCGILLVQGAKADVAKIIAMCATALVSLVIIVFGRHKNEFFLASFQWLLLLSAVYAIAILDQRLHRKARFLLMGGVIAGLLFVIWKNGALMHWHNSSDSLHGTSWNQKIIDLVRQHQYSHARVSKNGSGTSVFVSFAGPVNAYTMHWLATREGFKLDAFDQHLSADIGLAKSSAERADYLVLPNELSADYYRNLPSATIQAALLEWVLSTLRFTPVTNLSSDSRYFVFANAPLLETSAGTVDVDGIPVLEGFLGEEGPYPNWSLPRVRWMNKSGARLCILNSRIAPHHVVLHFRADGPGQVAVSDGEGTTLTTVTTTPGQFTNLSFTYTPKAAKNCLAFSAQIGPPASPERLLLFSKIEVRGE